MVRMATKEFGKIDILVNNAGGSAREKASEFAMSSEETWDWVLGRNLKGVLICTRAVINHMIESGAGRIISVSSVAGVGGAPGMADYSAAKAGIIGFSKALAKEVGRYGITVNCVSPGAIKTAGTGRVPKEVADRLLSQQVLNRSGETQDVANLVLFLASEDARYITGQNYIVDGGEQI
jgi:NAD(P)-dependent dehydrogenase (short-subunit alcohol dehydrogenase family)